MNRSDTPLSPPDPRSLELSCSVIGDNGRPAVLVLHGITASRRYWLPRIRPLAQRYRLLIPDLPGFGRSPKPFVDYRMEFFVHTLVGLLERHGLTERPIRVIGHSLGSLVALALAAEHPEIVQRMVLLNTPRYTDPESAHRTMLLGSSSYRSLLTINSLAANWAQVRRTGWGLTLRYLRRLPWAVLVDARVFTFRSLSSTLEHCVLRYRVDDVLKRLSPDLALTLLHGGDDQAAPLAGVRAIADRAPYPALRVIEGAGHHPFHTHTDECMNVIEEHL